MITFPVSSVSLECGQVALFASDMHLCAEEPATAEFFFAQLGHRLTDSTSSTASTPITHLFLLGDIFESWFGDDGADTVARTFIAMLRHWQQRGLNVYVMRGNRDFLLNASQNYDSQPNFSQQSGAILLHDETVLDAFGSHYLLCHADQLCTLDVEYQAFRTQTRSVQWQQAFLSRPFDERKEIAKRLRLASKANAPSNAITTNVAQDAVQSMMLRHNVLSLIHGHTHLPADHHFTLNGQQANRFVLPDWSESSGGFLKLSEAGIERITLPI